MSKIQQEYWDALDRIIKRQTIRIDSTSKISLDSVALEAGRKRGSIKKSRPSQQKLVAEIRKQAEFRQTGTNATARLLAKEKSISENYKRLYLRELNSKLMYKNQILKLSKKPNQ